MPTSFVEQMPVLFYGVGGFALGLVYFASLRRTVAMLVSDRGWWRPLAATLMRVAVVAAAFAAAAMAGAAPLLAAFAGFVLARGLSMRRARRVG